MGTLFIRLSCCLNLAFALALAVSLIIDPFVFAYVFLVGGLVAGTVSLASLIVALASGSGKKLAALNVAAFLVISGIGYAVVSGISWA